MLHRIIQQLFLSACSLSIVKKCKAGSSLLKIKAARAYTLGVKKVRILIMGGVAVAVALVLLFNGLALVQTAVLTYSGLSHEAKFMFSIIFGLVELAGAGGILVYVFKEENWVKFTEVHKVVAAVIDEKDKSDTT